MNPRIASTAMQFETNARFLASALDGIDDARFVRRAAPDLNSLQWLAAHLANARCNAAAATGAAIDAPWGDLVGGPKATMRDGVAYPSRAEIERVWAEATEKLREGLRRVTDEALDATLPVPVPLPDRRLEGVLAFLALHETYHVGQMSLMRKLLGVGPTKLF